MWGEGETGMMMEVTFSRVSRSTSRICMQGVGWGTITQCANAGAGARGP